MSVDSKVSRRYKDLDWNFFAHPVTKDISRKFDDDAVKNAMKSLVLTRFGERPFQPGIGSNVPDLLFELMTPVTAQLIKNSVEDVLKKYEPRAEVLDVIVKDKPDDNNIEILIYFTLINRPEPLVGRIVLERSR